MSAENPDKTCRTHFSSAAQVAQRIVPGSLWRHYKGNTYRVLAIARHSETGETLVVYCPHFSLWVRLVRFVRRLLRSREESAGVWARPVSMWLEIVEPFGVLRFTQID